MPGGGLPPNMTPAQLIGVIAEAVVERFCGSQPAVPNVVQKIAEVTYAEIQKAPVKTFEVTRVAPSGQRTTQHIGLTQALTELSDLIQVNNVLQLQQLQALKELNETMKKNTAVCKQILRQSTDGE